jgi:hypothetical protein
MDCVQIPKERPILFQGAMVRALLDGSKTQTRRICKNQPYSNGSHFDGHEILCHNDYLPPSAMLMDAKGYTTSNMEGWEAECPYGQPGECLWVRETFLDTQGTGIEHRDESGLRHRYAFAADCVPGSYGDQARKDYGLKWKPSIHMPRAASRILLEIVSVRVEQLQGISEKDARAEGVMIEDRHMAGYCAGEFLPPSIRAYRDLWVSINGAGSWDDNPWVWVVEFKRVTP